MYVCMQGMCVMYVCMQGMCVMYVCMQGMCVMYVCHSLYVCGDICFTAENDRDRMSGLAGACACMHVCV